MMLVPTSRKHLYPPSALRQMFSFLVELGFLFLGGSFLAESKSWFNYEEPQGRLHNRLGTGAA